MIKVFLVEDEIVMREGIKSTVQWEREGYEFVGEASDGELAYPMIQNLKPDIVITDIRMPFMDGLELSRLIKKELPETKVIILSGYSDFDYAKQAISIGVTDYLLKPISSAKLLEAVNRVAEMIRQERAQKEHTGKFGHVLEEYEKLERQRFFTDLMFNRMSMSEVLEKGKELEIDLAAQDYRFLLFCIRQSEELGPVYSEELVSVSQEIEKAFLEQERIYLFERGTEGWAFLLKADSEEELEALTRDASGLLKDLASGREKLEYFGGIGRAVKRLRELSESYNGANRAMSLRYMGRMNEIISCEQMQNMSLLQENDIDLSTLDVGKIDRKILLNFLKSGLAEDVRHFIEDYFEGLGEANVGSMLFRQYITMDMYFCTAAFIEELGQDAQCIVEHCGDFKGVGEVLSGVESTKDYLEKVIGEAIKLRDSASMKKYSTLLDKAKEYIAENYDKEDISLNAVAASVNLSPSHFSTIFSQETGETFIEYLTRVRMDKAKELLRCSNRKSTEIAYAVGYKDSHYFSYLFKKTQGCTPKEFRMKGQNQGL
ncbi:MAG: response regulator [Clostridiales bacterium]|nr:response regulator [Clostridiales bacterium]